ncbi:MAG: 23S rRNA (pseudouridine(1915)-N(3))-methyltransferase RlmH [Bacilli bacterium]|nr:23S rRNA (pseudouridine(1915)-N(3))-methyltransferase RlmH [Bacilli bacterium]
MMIKIICVGKIKEKYLKDAIEEYKKRISKYTKLEIIEVNDIDNPSIDIVLLKEKELIEKHIDTRDFVITMEIEGNMLSSIELARKIDNIFNTNSTITFVIGGSYGIHQDIKARSDYKLSFSKLTFPHQLFRVNLLEQIYRTFKINNNEAYHK